MVISSTIGGIKREFEWKMDENILISKTVQKQTLFFYQNGTLVRLSATCGLFAKLKWLKAKKWAYSICNWYFKK